MVASLTRPWLSMKYTVVLRVAHFLPEVLGLRCFADILILRKPTGSMPTFAEPRRMFRTAHMIRSHYLEALERSQVLQELAAFDPHVVGTPPLGVDVPSSDIDVVCFAPDADAFTRAVWEAFGRRAGFRVWQRIDLDRPVVASFVEDGWIFEIFGQATPVSEQYGWRHFLVEQRLLAFGGEAFRAAVMSRRAEGMKTEPAFAKVLGLQGDPYQALLRLGDCSDMDLTSLLRDRGFGEPETTRRSCPPAKQIQRP